MTTPRVRFAPSPTGYLHVGGARTALFNYLFAKKTGGTFILRIEDTDRERSTAAAIDAILEGMTWLGLDWDEGPFFQTQRFPLYQEEIDELVAVGKAYPCFCTIEELDANRKEDLAAKRKPKYRGTCRNLSAGEVLNKKTRSVPYSVRFKAPVEGETVIHDALRGPICFANIELDDLIIRRASDGYPTYNFTVVVDDATMGITHVIRGDDHLNNTPRQAQLYEAMGYPLPIFAHVPMILGADKQRLSKRHGATSVLAYREMGYLPEALLNYLVRLGWSAGDQEIFARDELIELFNLEGLTKSAGVFNPEKLLWMNGVYIRGMAPDRLAVRLLPYLAAQGIADPDRDLLVRAVAISQEKVKTLVELAQMIAFFFVPPSLDAELIAGLLASPEERKRLIAVQEAVAHCPVWDRDALKGLFDVVAHREGLKLKDFAQPLRVYLTGSKVSPGIFEVLEVLGKERTLERLAPISLPESV